MIRGLPVVMHLEPNVTLFIEPPPGIEVEEGQGLRVIRALYGSKQGAQRLDVMKHESLNKIGFKRMSAETSIYFTLPPSPLGLSIIGTVSDDFAIISSSKQISAEIKHICISRPKRFIFKDRSKSYI